jgi:putative FmdB family regulatory protein
MPFFEYVCGECGEQFEKLLPRREADALQVCPHCGSEHTRRVFSTFAVKKGGSQAGCAMADSCPSASFR